MKRSRLEGSASGYGGENTLTGVGLFGRIVVPGLVNSTILHTNLPSTSTGSWQELHHRPRPGHQLTLISFPSTIPSILKPPAIFETDPPTKQPSLPQEDVRMDKRNEKTIDGEGWTEGAKNLRVPKPSHSAKRLAKPLPFAFPSSAKSSSLRSASASSNISFAPLAYAKLKRNPYFSTVFLGQEHRYRMGGVVEDSPSGPSLSNNIDNKIGNKPKRHKTATPGLRKGITITKSEPTTLSSGFGKVVNSAGLETEEDVVRDDDGGESRRRGLGQHDKEHSLREIGDPVMKGKKMKNKIHPDNKKEGGLMSKTKTGGPLTKSNERLQVIRTQEERDESPESIRLDCLGLKTFPHIGGGEGPSLKLLSLQHNLISRIENVPVQLNHLVVLDLYDNRLERITSLQGFTSLRVLLLGKNRIRRIEGLEGLKRLEVLDLHGNQLRYVDNLGSLVSLRVLNLAGNLLRSIRNLGPYGLSSLIELNLKRNRIRNLEGLVKAPHLKKLLLANNDLQSFGCLFPLRKLVFLQELLLEPNPLCCVEWWRSQVVIIFPWLVTLDRCPVTDQMRLEAKSWHKRKLAEEETRRKEEERLRQGSPSGGPPGSREQVIYQARRRWESLKNFVKSTGNTNPCHVSKDGDVTEELDEMIRGEGISHGVGGGRRRPPGESQEDCLSIIPVGISGDGSKLQDSLSQHGESLRCERRISRRMSDKEFLNVPGDLEFRVEGGLDGKSVRSSGEPGLPGDPCPPSMINDSRSKESHKGGVEDYVNTNIISKREYQLSVEEVKQMRTRESKQTSLLVLSSETRNDFHLKETTSGAITNKIMAVQETGETTPSFDLDLCQQTGTQLMGKDEKAVEINDDTRSVFSIDEGKKKDDDDLGVKSTGESEAATEVIHDSGGLRETCEEKRSSKMRIAVVRPLVREENFDETISAHPLNTNSFPTSSSSSAHPHVTEQRRHRRVSGESPCLLLPQQISPSIRTPPNNTRTMPIRTSPLSYHQPAGSKDDDDGLCVNNNAGTNDQLGTHEEGGCDGSKICDDQVFCCDPSHRDDDKNHKEPASFDTSDVLLLQSHHQLGKAAEGVTSYCNSGEKSEGKGPSNGLHKHPVDLGMKMVINSESEGNKNGVVLNKSKRELRRSVSTCVIPSESFTNHETNSVSQPIDTSGEPNDAKSTKDVCSSTATLNMKNTSAIHCLPNENISENKVQPGRGNADLKKASLRSLFKRSTSFDGRLPSSSTFIRRKSDDNDDDYYDDGEDDDDDDTCSIATSTNTIATVSDVSPRGSKPPFLRKGPFFPRTKSQRLKLRDKVASRATSSTGQRRGSQGGQVNGSTLGNGGNGPGSVSFSATTFRHSGTSGDIRSNKTQALKRCESAVAGGLTGLSPSESTGANNSSSLKKQGTDYLVEIDGKALSIYGQGALKHTLTGFPGSVTCSVTIAKFHYISFDSIIPYFGKLRQIYPSLEHFQFRANNLTILGQLNALSDLQGLTSLHIAKEGNPLVSSDSGWIHYSGYRLSHWGLQNVNGKEVSSEYRGGQTNSPSSKCFESLGFLALSCLPQAALTPLAKRLHTLHCFCCCSPSTSSDDSGRGKMIKGTGGGSHAATLRPGSPSTGPAGEDHGSSSSGNACTSWDDDPVLLDVIGKEALVYCPISNHRVLSPPTMMEESSVQKRDKSPNRHHSTHHHLRRNGNDDSPSGRRRETLYRIVESGIEILEKLDMLETVMPSLMTEMVQDILTDYMFMDACMKKELKKCQDAASIALHGQHKKHSHH